MVVAPQIIDMFKILKYILAFTVTLTISSGYGQLKEYPIQQTNTDLRLGHSGLREKEVPLSLPFWDDFSFSVKQPSDTLWEASGVYINDGFSITPPSIGVASFDGLKADGLPYSGSTSSIGKTDSLTSLPIDLSALTVNDNVFLSFFYQFAGNGDTPEESDSIRVEFKDASGIWVGVWPEGSARNTDGSFSQVIEKLDDPAFFHDAFQFKFVTYGRQSGAFDVWNVDYVYLNKNRSAADLFYPDRTISTPFISLFGDYTAIPYAHFDKSLIEYPTLQFYNLEGGTVSSPYGYKVGGVIRYYSDTVKAIPFDTLFINAVGQPLAPGTIQSLQIDPFLDGVTFEDADSAFIEALLAIDAGDNTDDYDSSQYLPIDFRVNDTTRTTFALSSYYAYDDGEAESAAGLLNGSGKSLAYQYDMIGDKTDTLVAVDVYFPYINGDPTGKQIELSIWESLDIEGESTESTVIVHRQNVSITRGLLPNDFIRIGLSRTLILQGTFYIGYKQISGGDLGIGLDKNTDSGDKMLFNIDGLWRRNSIVSGSLMFRPVFGLTPEDLVNGIDHDDHTSIRAFPNPSRDIFTIKGRYTDIRVLDIRGIDQPAQIASSNANTQIDLRHLPDGLYILKLRSNDRIFTLKIHKKE